MGKRRKLLSATAGEKVFDVFVYATLGLCFLLWFFPLIYVLLASFTPYKDVVKGSLLIIPSSFTLTGYEYIFNSTNIFKSFGNTLFIAVVGTSLSMTVAILLAFPLSRKDLPGRSVLLKLLVFTMYFSGGLIPTYMVVTGLGLYNSRLAMILPVLLSTYNMMICRSAMEAVPEDLFECASLEGANDFYMLTRIAVPLVKPTLAVLTLYYAVARYNDFFNAMLYLGKSELQPLQMFLRRILILSSAEVLQQAGTAGAAAAAQNTLKIRYVCIVLAAVPIFCITPFVQKYLVSGTMLGAVKG